MPAIYLIECHRFKCLSPQYNVPVAELKRVNNILSEQELHGRTEIRVPLHQFSLLLPDTQEDRGGEDGWRGRLAEEAGPTLLERRLAGREAGCETGGLREVVVGERQPLLASQHNWTTAEHSKQTGCCSLQSVEQTFTARPVQACVILIYAGFVVAFFVLIYFVSRPI